MVTYGVNISAIVQSIIHKVRYTVEDATGMEVAKVNVYVDGMRAGIASRFGGVLEAALFRQRLREVIRK